MSYSEKSVCGLAGCFCMAEREPAEKIIARIQTRNEFLEKRQTELQEENNRLLEETRALRRRIYDGNVA